MYHRLATRLVMKVNATNTIAVEHSQAVMLETASYVSIDAQLLNQTGTPDEFEIELQQSNDLENWYTLSSPGPLTFSGEPAASFVPSGTLGSPVVARFVRLRYTLTYDAEDVVVAVAAGINVAPA